MSKKIPQTDDVKELAKFWDEHDLTEFEDELEEATQRVFVRDPVKIAERAAELRKLTAHSPITDEELARAIDEGRP